MSYREIKTDVPEIIVRMWPNGAYQLVDTCREISSPIAPYEGVVSLEMPHDLKSPETGRGYYIWLTEAWAGFLPTETLLEVF